LSNTVVAQRISDKTHFHIEETFTEIAIFSNLKSAQEELFINDQQHNEYLVYYFLIAFIQLDIIGFMAMTFIYNADYQLYVSRTNELIYVQQSCCLALHFILFPKIN